MGVGVAASSSAVGGETGLFVGLLPRERECSRRAGLLFDPARLSEELPMVGVGEPLDIIDVSLVRGEGGITVTLGLIEVVSLSLSDGWMLLLREIDGLWVVLGLETEIVGWRDVGEGEGDRAPSRCVFVFTSFEKKLGAMMPSC